MIIIEESWHIDLVKFIVEECKQQATLFKK